MRTFLIYVVVTTSLAILGACGGGGGGSTAVDPAPTLNLQTAWKSFRQQSDSGNYAITGTLDGDSVGGTGELITNHSNSTSLLVIDVASPFPGPSVTWTNLSRSLMQFVSNYVINGATTVVSSSENYYYDSTDNLKVIWNVDDNEQTIITSTALLPTQVTAGSTGTFYTGTVYSRLGYTCGTRSVTYSVAARTATSLTVTFTDTETTTRQHIGQCSDGTYVTRYVYELTASGMTIKSSTGSSNVASGSVTLTF